MRQAYINYDRPSMGVDVAGQLQTHTSLIFQRAHSLYHRAYPSSLHRQESCTSSRRVTLPCTKAQMQTQTQINMPSPPFNNMGNECHVKRSGSSNSSNSRNSRRSVKVMKNLLPLKLASPRPHDHFSPLSSPKSRNHSPSISPRVPLASPRLRVERSVTPSPIQRFTFGFSPETSPSIKQRRAEKYSCIPAPSTTQPENHSNSRFEPVNTEHQLDELNYADDETCLSCSPAGSTCDESCIINDYESSTDEESIKEDWMSGLAVKLRDSTSILPEDAKEFRDRTSDLSFKCRGEPEIIGTALCPDEAAWLSSSPTIFGSSPRPVLHIQRRSNVSEHVNDAWLSDSSSCSDFDECDQDVFAFATALAPAKAQVIDVNMLRSSVLTVKIPPRSSSLAYPLTPECGRQSRMSFREPRPPSFDDDDPTPRQKRFRDSSYYGGRFDLARSSPPVSPISTPCPSAWDSPQSLTLCTLPDTTLEPLPGDSLSSIIAALNNHTADFSTTMLLPDSSCVRAIRNYDSAPPETHHPPPSPRYLNSVDWRPHRPVSLSTLSAFGSSSKLDLKPPTHFSLTSADHTFQSIFPNSSPFYRAALYAHLLAYSFLSTHLSTLPTTTAQPTINVGHNRILTTTSYALPPKAASVLGAPSFAARPLYIDGVDIGRIEECLAGLKTCIGWLVLEMEGASAFDTDDEGVIGVGEVMDGLILRSLVEVVRGCEGQAVY